MTRQAKRLVFVSHRTGAPQIFFEDRASGELVQVTDRNDLADWSIYPSPDGRFVYFTAGTGAWRVDLSDFSETQLADFGAVEMREKGMVGAAMGTTALSADGDWWAIPVKAGKVSRFVVVDTQTGTSRVILERDTIGHPQFCPDDDNLILYAGPLTDRVWIVGRDGDDNRRVYEREDSKQWVTHEVWLPGRRAVAFVDWPRGMRLIDIESGDAVMAAPLSGLACGAGPRAASASCATPIFPIPACTSFRSTAPPALLCASEASSEGAHWGGPFPYNDGPVAVEARQHTHPHPRFSPDGSRVVFTSDRTGHAQIYEVELDRSAGMNADGLLRANAFAGKSATDASPERAAGSRPVSCSAIWRSCRRHLPSISCCIASAISAPARCWKSPTQAIRCRTSWRQMPICAPIARATRSSLTESARPTVRDIKDLWRDDLVSFLIGSGITFDAALERAGVPTDRNRWVLRTDRPTEPAGPFRGDLIVTMRWLTPQQAITAVQVSARFPFNHGAPIHIGDPAGIGADLANPMFGGPVPPMPSDQMAVFWACGVTPQSAAEAAKLPLFIVHAAAHSFITDLPADRLMTA